MPLFEGFMGLKIFEFISLMRMILIRAAPNLSRMRQKSDLFGSISVLKFAASFK